MSFTQSNYSTSLYIKSVFTSLSYQHCSKYYIRSILLMTLCLSSVAVLDCIGCIYPANISQVALHATQHCEAGYNLATRAQLN